MSRLRGVLGAGDDQRLALELELVSEGEAAAALDEQPARAGSVWSPI